MDVNYQIYFLEFIYSFFYHVGISHAVKNPAFGRVAQKCGLTFEGTKQEYFKATNGKFLDISDYGIIRREWEKLRSYTQWEENYSSNTKRVMAETAASTLLPAVSCCSSHYFFLDKFPMIQLR